MLEIQTRLAAVSFDGFFKKAILLKDAGIPQIAEKSLEAFTSYGLRATKINLVQRDVLFNYELSFSLFNGNGEFKVTAEKVHIEFQNLVAPKDSEIVTDCVAKMYEHVPLPAISSIMINANAHVVSQTAGDTQKYLSRYAKPAIGILSGGAVVYLRSASWTEEIRLVVEKSLSLPDHLFLAWTTTVQGAKLTRADLANLKSALDESVTKADLVFCKS